MRAGAGIEVESHGRLQGPVHRELPDAAALATFDEGTAVEVSERPREDGPLRLVFQPAVPYNCLG